MAVLIWTATLLPVYFLGSWLCSQIAYILRPDFVNLNDQSIAGMLKNSYWLMGIGTVLLVPMAEETLFRGLIFHGLYSKNKALAFAVSTTISPISFTASILIPVFVEPTFTELQTRSVLASA